MQLNPHLLAFAVDAVKQANQAPAAAPQVDFSEKAASAIAHNAYWDEMSKLAAVAEDGAREDLFNRCFVDEFTKLAADFSVQYNFVPQGVAELFEG